MNLIMGKNTISEVLKHNPSSILEVFTSKDKTDPLIQNLKNKNIALRFVSKKALTSMVKSESHQNIIAQIKSRNYLNLKDFLKKTEDKESTLVLMLDNIYDPQNFGTILRTANCFSVDAVIFSKNRGSDITPTVSKAASGATELVDLIKVSNLATSLDLFINAGYSIVSTVLDKNSQDLYKFSFPYKTVLIMGSEGEGIQKLLLKKSDNKIHIPMSGPLQSLNVSAAAAIILSYYRFGQI